MESNNSLNNRPEEPQRQANEKYFTPAKKTGVTDEKPLTSTKDYVASGVEEDEGLQDRSASFGPKPEQDMKSQCYKNILRMQNDLTLITSKQPRIPRNM